MQDTSHNKVGTITQFCDQPSPLIDSRGDREHETSMDRESFVRKHVKPASDNNVCQIAESDMEGLSTKSYHRTGTGKSKTITQEQLV